MKYPNFGAIVEDKREARRIFFNLAFGRSDGYICVAYKSVSTKDMIQEFYHYPSQLEELLSSIDRHSKSPCHAYYCPQVLKSPTRNRSNVLTCPSAWADLDACDPALLSLQPSVLTQTSPGRFQALWVFDRLMDPQDAEDISRRIAYNHSKHGADATGWDLSQLLRIPYTPNFKYSADGKEPPIVIVVDATHRLYRKSDFSVYPELAAFKEISDEAIPEPDETDPLEIMQRYRSTLNPLAFGIFSTVPTEDDDWSAFLWKLGKYLVEAGMERRQVFTVLCGAACNKYERDQRSKNDLWREVKRLFIKNIETTLIVPTDAVMSEILSEEEREHSQENETFIERYINWAIQLTDAPPQYHQAGAFILLSTMISSSVILPTSFGRIIPNMWFMLAADTTITRKTTAMNIATRMIFDINDEIVFATDGTMEGILTGLKTRDGKSALFYRDEFTGLLQAMARKDYMSDMPEHLTKLYDGEPMRRLLRKEEISVNKPVFLILGGGIKSKIQTLLTEEHIASGFVPRFVFITAEADMDRIRPVGPPVADNTEYRETIKNELVDISNHYNKSIRIKRDETVIGTAETRIEASLTAEAWDRYNKLERTMIEDALKSGLHYLTPVYDRLAKSTLKAAVLISASRQRSGHVSVDVPDLLKAIYYCQGWRSYANEMIMGIGKSQEERLIDKITVQLKNTPGGISKSDLMNYHRLNSKSGGGIFETMIQRRIMYAIPRGNNDAMFYFIKPEDK